ncbi:universal stress protein [Embleya sp. NBC_00896]|uniref:universal stress protein n=1 Tax=Embleya sp. NBC_00896 TaxID=2975961 RepID=UPI002F9160CA|nr:universal stress protein [Embleya sp. NBC_00896]
MTTFEGSAPVVVGVENTDAARLAVLWAADEAVRRGLPLRLVNALDWPVGVDSDPNVTGPLQTWGGVFRDAGRRALDAAGALVVSRHPGLGISESLVDGEPAEVMREQARDAAMVVLGSRRLSSVRELMTTGGIAVPVVAHARCPVVIVREPEHATGDPLTIVVGVDGSRVSERAVAYAFDEASLRGAAVLAVQVRPFSASPVVGAVGNVEELEEGRARLAETLAGWNEKYPDVRVHREVVFGHPVSTLAQVSEHALCVVVGTRGLGGFKGMLLGSVSHGLLHHARCPVVVVPRERDDDHDQG